MTKADKETFDEFKDGLNKWLDSFKENIDLRLNHMDEKIEAFTKATTRKPLINKERAGWSVVIVGGVILQIFEKVGWITL